MFERFITYNYGSGHNFELAVCNRLRSFGFTADTTGKDDKGVDIVAQAGHVEGKPKFYIQCKFQNTPVSMAPIQEVFFGTHYRGNDGYPVVITNNAVTAEARRAANKQGIEIIGDIEWQELQDTWLNGKIVNKARKGLMGMLAAIAASDNAYAAEIANKLVKPENREHEEPVYNEKLEHSRQIIKEKYDEALICEQEAAELDRKATYLRQQSITLQKEASLANLEYG